MHSRACPCIASRRFPAVGPDPFLELAPQLVYLFWAVCGIVREARQFLGVGGIFRTCGEQGGIGRVACGDQLDVIRGEWNMHALICTSAMVQREKTVEETSGGDGALRWGWTSEEREIRRAQADLDPLIFVYTRPSQYINSATITYSVSLQVCLKEDCYRVCSNRTCEPDIITT